MTASYVLRAIADAAMSDADFAAEERSRFASRLDTYGYQYAAELRRVERLCRDQQKRGELLDIAALRDLIHEYEDDAERCDCEAAKLEAVVSGDPIVAQAVAEMATGERRRAERYRATAQEKREQLEQLMGRVVETTAEGVAA